MVDGMPPELGGTLRIAEKMLPTVQNLLSGAGSGADSAQPGVVSVASESLRTPQGLARRAAQDFFASLSREIEPAKDEFGKLLNLAREKRASDPSAALKNVESYLAVKPDDYEARLLGEALYALVGDYDAMEAGADALLTLRKGDPVGYFWRGLARFLRGEMDPCLADLALAGQSKPLTPWAQSVRAFLFLEIGRPSEAIQFLDEAITRSPDLLVALLARAVAYGAVYAQSGDDVNIRKAVSDLSDVIAKEPKNVEALTMRGEHYGSLAEFASAAADFDAAIDLGASSNLLIAKWTFAKIAQAKKEQTASAASLAVEANVKPVATDAAAPNDITTRSMQEWFSRFVYPGGSDQTGSGLGATGALSPAPFAPIPPAPPQKPTSVKVETAPSGTDAGTAESAGDPEAKVGGAGSDSQESSAASEGSATQPGEASGATNQPQGSVENP